MKLNCNSVVYVVGKSEYVLKNGERAGEVVNRLSISDGKELFQDVSVADGLNVADIVLFNQPYNITFDYSVRSFGDKVWKNFSIASLKPVK